jgi:hypothetical protein
MVGIVPTVTDAQKKTLKYQERDPEQRMAYLRQLRKNGTRKQHARRSFVRVNRARKPLGKSAAYAVGILP